MDSHLENAIARIPRLAGRSAEALGAERLGGMTNLVYRLNDGGEQLVLRIPGEGTEAYIDRGVEAHNTRAAARAGVGAEVLHFDETDGLMLMRSLEGCRTMSPEGFQAEDAAADRAGEVLARMHNSGEIFRFRFELFTMIDEYLQVLSGLDTELPEGYHDVLAEAGTMREALDAQPAALAPCHCDPLCENFLDDGERMWVVDWEYSGMNDPLWDVGDFSVEAGLSRSQDERLMRAYLGREPNAAEWGRMVLYKAASDLLWTLWGLIQHGNGNPAEDFWAYSTERFARCKALMADPAFAGHVAAVRRGE
ncbi:choline/ethanolamine kinase family protein [Arhodomonas aquaeolei]|uniref:choline/ethanolamine kinase family protein n=1 Tax=Arhodomonas aquaeolei TaxID=2369 RepID=UPI0003611CBC|nr:choline/ethanolamine kinase family protein [Arhodomonas aquaeolei]